MIRGSSQRFAPYSEDVLTSKEVLDGILFEVVDECLRGVVADLIGRLVGGYLHECSQARANDVFTAAVDAIIADVCDDALPGIVRQVVQSMVDEYLALVDDMAKVEILMAPMVDEICDDIAEEVLVKHTVDGLVDQWADELTERVCRSTWERVQKQTAADHKVVEAQIIRKHSSTLLDKVRTSLHDLRPDVSLTMRIVHTEDPPDEPGDSERICDDQHARAALAGQDDTRPGRAAARRPAR